MKPKHSLLFLAALIVLAIPLVFAGNAGAKYRGDGAVQDATSGVWKVADQPKCYVRDTATEVLVDGIGDDDGVCETGEACTATYHIDPTLDRTVCRAITAGVATQAECTIADAALPTYVGRWSGGVCTGNGVNDNAYTANPAGENSALGDREGCLHCHGGPKVSATAMKANYMNNGHKNMLRKVTAGTPHLGPDGLPYTVDGSGNTFDWLLGKITTATGTWNLKWIYGDWLAPTPTAMYLDSTKNMSYSCSKCHATGTSVDSAIRTDKEPVASGTLLSTDIGTGSGQIKLSLGLAGYTTATHASWDQWGIMCSRCHSSGSAPEVAGFNTQALCEGGGYVWVVPGHGTPYCSNYDMERVKWNPDYMNYAEVPLDAIGNDDGICETGEACTGTIVSNIALLSAHAGGPSNGPEVVRLCGECHRQETSGQPYTYVGAIGPVSSPTAWNKGFGDQAQTVLGGDSHGAPSPAVGHNYMNVFLNSPHARFSGTYGDITDLTKYGSNFMKSVADGGLAEPGCIGCHNVHDSLVVGGHEPFENECTDCHQAADGTTTQVATTQVATFNHPAGPGTPFEHAGTDLSIACEECHMPQALHFMRINTDAAYSTYTYVDANGDGKADVKADNTSADNGYASAVWLDVDLACGQCHDGSVPEAPVFDKTQSAAAAAGMHGGAAGNCGACHTVTPGTDHHGATGATCTECHDASGDAPRHDGTMAGQSNPDCLACHTSIIQGTNHHNGTCTTCHGTTGGLSAWATAGVAAPNTNAKTWKTAGTHNPLPYWSLDGSLRTACLGCHSTTKVRSSDGSIIGAIVPSGTGDNHHGGHTSVPGTAFGGVSEEEGSRGDNDPGMTCVGCHGGALVTGGNYTEGYTIEITASGLSTTTVSIANGIHPTLGGANATSSLCLGCHDSTEIDQSGADQNHHAGICGTCHHYDGSFSGTYGAGVTSLGAGQDPHNCQNCHATAQGTKRAVNQGVDHHSGACAQCHGEAGGVSAWTEAGVAAPDTDATTLKPAGSHNPLPYWSIDTSLRTACLGCHSTTQTRSSDSTTIGAIVPSSTGDNHHNGHSSVPGTTFGGVSEANGSRGDNDPGMNCVGCHGGATVNGPIVDPVSGLMVGYAIEVTASGLSTTTVATGTVHPDLGGDTATSSLCLGCHDSTEIDQSGADQNHHAGACVTCHHTDGSWSGTFAAGVGSIPAGQTESCTNCHASKSTFASTGHANSGRLVPADFNITGPAGANLECGHDGFYNVADGKCYTDLTFTTEVASYVGKTVEFMHHSWFEPEDHEGTMVSGARMVKSGDAVSCMGCHTTGFQVSAPADKATYPLDSWGVNITKGYSPLDDSINIAETTGDGIGDDDGTCETGEACSGTLVGSWDEFGVQCQKCHGHAGGYKPATDLEVTSTCGECHVMSHHTTGALNGPHTSYTGTAASDLVAGTYAKIQDPANYNASAEFQEGCVGCHDVHNSAFPTANPAGGAVKECTECHTTGSHAVVQQHPATATCTDCHMAGGNKHNHFFRISTDPTFTDANQAAVFNGSYPKVGGGQGYIPLNDACGSCHGSSGEGHLFTTAKMAEFAVQVHAGEVIPTDCASCHADKSQRIGDMSQLTCTQCHNRGGINPTTATCLGCHTMGSDAYVGVALTQAQAEAELTAGMHSNAPPVAGFTTVVNADTWQVSVTDTSTDAEGLAAVNPIRVTWGDTFSSVGSEGGTFTHTYGAAGTYTITLTATDAAGLTDSETASVTVSAFTISGNAAVAGATLSLKDSANRTIASTTSCGTEIVPCSGSSVSGDYSFGNVKPGSYKVTVYKTGTTFNAPNPAAVTVGPSQPVNFTTVQTKFKITAVTTGVEDVKITVKNSYGTIVSQGYTNSSAEYSTAQNLTAGTYTVTAYKRRYNFDGDPVTAGSQKTVAVTVGPDKTVTFTH